MNKQKLLKERKKKRRIFNQGLRHVPKIEKDSYYHSNHNGHLKFIDALDVKDEGVSFGTLKKLYQQLSVEHSEQTTQLNSDIALLTAFLLEGGYNTPNVELKALIEDIRHLKVLYPNKEYIGYKIVNGYVVGYGYDIVIEKGEQPDDFDKGYWKLENEQWVLDSIRYQQIWGG